MRILFWNTGRRPVVDLLRVVCRRRHLDVLVLAEMAGPVGDVVDQLSRDAEYAYFSADDRLAKGGQAAVACVDSSS